MTIAAHPRAVADAADGTVISIITEDNGVRSIFRGKDGFLSGDVRGMLFIEMSTLQPMTGRELAPVVEAAGARLIDSPVLGTIPSARDGKLFAMVGGRAGGRGARPSGAGEAHPQDRAHGAERRGLRHEARGQSRPRRVHPGDRRIARARHARGPVGAADARRARPKRRPPTAGSPPRRSCLPASPTTSRSISRRCART